MKVKKIKYAVRSMIIYTLNIVAMATILHEVHYIVNNIIYLWNDSLDNVIVIVVNNCVSG